MDYRFAVVGNPINHSMSPFIHHAFAKQIGIIISYEKILIPIDEFAHTIHLLQNEGLLGINITAPFKEQAYAIASASTLRAKQAQAANIFSFSKHEIYADNTDGIGLIRDIQQNIGYDLQNKRILVCGSGGAARSIIPALLAQKPLQLVIANRNLEKSQQLTEQHANTLSIITCHYSDLRDEEFDVIIDATSHAAQFPLPQSIQLSPKPLCYDLKYSPRNTALMNWAKSKHVDAVYDGLGMLVEQAAEAFRLWTNFSPQIAPVLSLLRNHMRANND